MAYIAGDAQLRAYAGAVEAYRAQYGVAPVTGNG